MKNEILETRKVIRHDVKTYGEPVEDSFCYYWNDITMEHIVDGDVLIVHFTDWTVDEPEDYVFTMTLDEVLHLDDEELVRQYNERYGYAQPTN